MTPATRLACAACGAAPAERDPYPFQCPHLNVPDGRDHVLARTLDRDAVRFVHASSVQPFVRHRDLLHSHTRALALGMSDADWVSMVEALDRAVAAVDQAGFVVTPFAPSLRLAAAAGAHELWVKDETRNVGGSHKARHLFGIALHLEVSERAGLVKRAESDERGLAIASCGNAALAAAVVARASRRPLRVFIPTDADPGVVQRLHALGAMVAVCPRRDDVPGDPCVHGFHDAIAGGAIPFGVQGNENGLTVEGGETLGWEMADAMRRDGLVLDRLFVQVGGGALASACIQALREARDLGVIAKLPKLHTVQTEGAWPLRRAWARVAERAMDEMGHTVTIPPEDGSVHPEVAQRLAQPESAGAVRAAMTFAREHRPLHMWPWETAPHSVAHGILDDETYDWAAVVEGMLETGGWPIVADEPTLVAARALAHEAGVRADATGAASLAGVLDLAQRNGIGAGERLAVLLTGVER